MTHELHGLTRAQLMRRGATAGAGLVTAGAITATLASDPALADVRGPRRSARFRAEVVAYLERHSPRFLVDHCLRSFALAQLFARAFRVEVDEDVLFAGVLLHDLGLTADFHSSTTRFEVASADAARAFVLAHGMSRRRAERVWDVAVLHAEADIAVAKSPETNVAANAIAADVTGGGLDRFDPDVIARIMRTRPGFARPFIDAIVADLQDKPEVADGTWMESVALDHIPAFKPGSVERAALADPFES